MSTIQSSNEKYSAYDREYFYEITSSAVFSSFFCAVKYRRDSSGLTQKDLASRIGKDKTQVSRILSGPSNWTLKTICDLAFALDLDVKFVLLDKGSAHRTFAPHGVLENKAVLRRRAPIIPAIAHHRSDQQQCWIVPQTIADAPVMRASRVSRQINLQKNHGMMRPEAVMYQQISQDDRANELVGA